MTAPTLSDPASWDDVLAAHRGDLVRTAHGRLYRGADAEDVVHDVVLRVLKGGRSVTEVGTPTAYLRRAVANECVSRWRRASHEVLVDAVPDSLGGGHADSVVSSLAVRRALLELTEQQRRVIVLTLLEDRPDQEVADLLGITPVTVRTTRRRALARLRTLLTDPAEVTLAA